MSTVRWSIVVRGDVDKSLRAYLGRRGTKKGDLSQFVEEAVQARLFELTVQDVKQRNRDYRQDDILEAINEALANG
ncbi:MAG: ribbon-helix-helix domain-containing protein [Gammaproteobacteria bacterium]|nr:ribbon-helix-helix domain-containing protein [Gammaproteobacteria bacterium]